MAEEDDASKTEEPTPKKLSKARDEGQVAQSTEVKSWALLLGGTLGVLFLAPGMMDGLRRTLTKFVAQPHTIAMDPRHLQVVVADLLADVALSIGPLIGFLVALALAAGLAQVGLLWAPKKIQPKFSNLSIKQGVQRIVGVRALAEFAKGLVKIGLVSVLGVFIVLPLVQDLELLPGYEVGQILERLWAIAIRLVLATCGVMTVVAVLDYVFQRQQHIKKLRMTKQEVKDEHKQAEGDPMVRAKIRQLRSQRARQRMMANVPKSDVVITNPTHYAVALEYKLENMGAPKLLAKGVDSLAHRIRDMAKEHDIPVVENPPLARALYASVELDQEIPPEHYKAVAEVIGYVMRLKGKLNG